MSVMFITHGDFRPLMRFFERCLNLFKTGRLDEVGRKGVELLASATPVDTGLTASSWYYEIERTRNSVSIVWKNSNANKGENIAVLIQYGHAVWNAGQNSVGANWKQDNYYGYVTGIDYINPVMRPLFEKTCRELWKEVTK